MKYADLTEEQKAKRRESWRKWAAKNANKLKEKEKQREPRNDYAKEQRKLKPDQYKEYGRKSYHKNKNNNTPSRTDEYRMFTSAKKRAIKHGIPFEISPEDILIPDFCVCCQVKMARPSLDKIIPELGYVKGNTAVICLRCNQVKNNGDARLHRQIADYIDEFTKTN